MIGLMAPHCEKSLCPFVLISNCFLYGQGTDLSFTLLHNFIKQGGWMNRRFEVYQYRQILLHMRQGYSDRMLAKVGLIGRKKAGVVREIAKTEGWLEAIGVLPDDHILAEKLQVVKARLSSASQVAPFADLVRKWVEEGHQITTIFSALKREKGFSGHYSAVRRFVQQIRPADHNPTMILDFKPGETVQVDFGSGPVIINPETQKPEKTWFFLMTLSYSRHAYGEIVTNQKIATWQECHRRAFEFFGGVPRKAIIDNLKAGILKACLYDPEVQRSYEAFAEGYGFIIAPCPPRDPQKKGRVESGVKYVKNSFLPLRSFRSIADANRQLREWLLGEAGYRVHGTTGKEPLTAFQTLEKMHLQRLPEVPPETVEWAKGQVYRNNHVRFNKSWYSAPFSLIGKDVWVRAGPRMIQVFHQNDLVATHARCFVPGEHQTVNDHLSPACRYFQDHTPEWCREQAGLIGVCCQEVIERLLSHPRLDCLRAAQKILSFQETHGRLPLEAACEQALVCESLRVSTIRGILAKDAAELPPPELGSSEAAYQGNGRFIRENLWSPAKKGDVQ